MFLRNLITATIIVATPMCAVARTVATEAAIEAWGRPKYITDPWTKSLGNDNIPDKTFWIMPKKIPNNANDEAIVMVYAARRIVEHGGYFCATQLRSRNKGTKKIDKAWTIYVQPSGNTDATCFWLCEPGYTGINCAAGRATSAAQCNYTRLSVETVTDGISYWESNGYDSNTIESAMQKSEGFFWHDTHQSDKRNESDAILAAKSFLDNGHGIVASPAQVTAHCGSWSAADYSDSHLSCTDVSDITVTALGSSFISKTLCMQGFDGPGCTTTLCRECDDPLRRYSETTGGCTACIENYHETFAGDCIKCGENEVFDPVTEKCIECKKTEYPKDGKCLPRQQISKQTMYNCWPNTDATDFTKCIKPDCSDDTTVKCMVDNHTIGKKTCVNKKWGECKKIDKK